MAEQRIRQQRWEHCPACGHPIAEWESRCEKCGRRPPPIRGGIVPVAPSQNPHSTSGQKQDAVRNRRMIAKPRPPAFPEHLRKELQERVERFRDRHRDHSLPLPFEESDPSGKIVCFPSPTVAPVGPEERLSSARPARSSYRQEVASPTAPQSTLEFSDSASEEETAWWVLPVAPLRRRVMGHLTDVGIVMGAAAVFLLPLPLVGGRIVPDAMLLGGIACGALLLALLYGWIFLVRTGTTPGMRFAGLRLVNFDGLSTTPRQRLWRLGGVVVSAGSFLIGFLWAALDEERLYWHDHISKTFLTASDQ